MSKPKPKTALTVLPAEKQQLAAVTRDFAEARRFWDGTKVAASMAIYGAVMTGIELERLKKRYGITRGGDRKSGSNPTTSGLKWDEIVKREMGFGDDWAARLIKFGSALSKRLKPLRDLKLLGLAPADLKKEVREKLAEAIRAKFDGETVTSLMQELGIIKTPRKIGGGAGGPTGPRLTPRQELEELAFHAAWEVQGPVVLMADDPEFDVHLKLLPLDADPEARDHRAASLVGLRDALRDSLARVQMHVKERLEADGKVKRGR